MWLRSNAVNILKYLPEFVQKDNDFKAVGETLSQEQERQRQQIQEIFAQMFIETATWGLSLWEELLEITPRAGANYGDRRRSILLRLQSNQVSTKEFMARLVARYTDDGKAAIEEHNEGNYFRVIVEGIIIDKLGIIEGLEMYKPANLAYDFLFKIMDEFVDALEASEELRIRTRYVFQDNFPHPYRMHDGKERRVGMQHHDGSVRHGGQTAHNGAPPGAKYHNADTNDHLSVLTVKTAGFAETPTIEARHDGAQSHNGEIKHAATDGAMDAGGSVLVTKQIFHDGRHNHNGGNKARHDGRHNHSGTVKHNQDLRRHQRRAYSDRLDGGMEV